MAMVLTSGDGAMTAPATKLARTAYFHFLTRNELNWCMERSFVGRFYCVAQFCALLLQTTPPAAHFCMYFGGARDANAKDRFGTDLSAKQKSPRLAPRASFRSRNRSYLLTAILACRSVGRTIGNGGLVTTSLTQRASPPLK